MGLVLVVLLGLLGPQAKAAPGYDSERKGNDRDQPFSYERTLDLTQQKVVFNPIGQFATDVTFAHLQLQVPFDMYLDLMKGFEQDVNRTREVAKAFRATAKKTKEESLRTRNREMARIIDEGIDTAILMAQVSIDRFTETIFKLPRVEESELEIHRRKRTPSHTENEAPERVAAHRQKRQLELVLGIGASIIGLIWDVYKYQDVKDIKVALRKLEGAVSSQQDHIKKLFHTTLEQTKILKAHEQYHRQVSEQLEVELKTDAYGTLLKMRSFVQLMDDQIRIFGDTVKLAQLGKLNPDQFSYAQLKELSEFIWSMEDLHQLHSPIKRASDLFTMPLSYLYDLDNRKLEFIIHVPMYREAQLLDMYEYHPFPMTLSNDRTRVAVPRPGGHNLLAYNSLHEYQTMSTTDLQNCFVIRRIHYCPNRQVLKTDWSKTCLSALFKMNQEAATRYCDFQIQPADERVLKLDAGHYLIYTNRQVMAERHCGNQHETLPIQEGTTISVDSGCRIKLDQHQIYGESSFTKVFENPKVFSWSWDANRILRNHSGDALKHAIQALEHEAGMTSFETEDLLQQMELQQLQQAADLAQVERLELQQTLESPFSFFHWISIGFSAIITFVVVTLVAWCVIRYLRMRQQCHAPSAPAAPHPALEMQARPDVLVPAQPPRGNFRPW